MPTVHYPSAPTAEIIDVEFMTPTGASRLVRLLVDTGFTGKSSVILNASDIDLVWAPVPAALARGALQGQQRRAWVTCRVPRLTLEWTFIAILADVSLLSLPAGVQGMAGLRFLRHFARWGAERTADGSWKFFLSDG